MRREFKWDKKYLYWGITAFCVIGASVMLYFVLKNVPAIGAFFGKLNKILAPFFWGLMISFIMHPLMEKLQNKMPKAVAVLICIVIVLVVLAALVWLIIPQLYSSIETIVINMPEYVDEVNTWIDVKLQKRPELEQAISTSFGNFNEYISDILRTKLMPYAENIVTNLTSGVYSMVRGVFNLLIGIIVAAYVLGNLNAVSSGTRKILYSIFTIPAAERFRSGLRFVDRTFLNFFSGKLLDSFIIGVICYFSCLILNMPYALLVSVIVGVTNIIPFFGPFIGAIPSAFLILLVSPIKCLLFVIFIFILQQIDGNIIGPKILGSSIGINGFWVMFAIIVGGGLFGFWGMLFGVPTFVCIYTGLKTIINRKLKRSELPTDSTSYIHLDHIDRETGEMIHRS